MKFIPLPFSSDSSAIQSFPVQRIVPSLLALALAILISAEGRESLRLKAAPANQTPPCEVWVNKTARPTNIELGQRVQITLEVNSNCQGGGIGQEIDLALAIDRSASQFDNGTWPATVQSAAGFLDLIDFNSTQVALITFSGSLNPLAPPEVHQTLSGDAEAVKAALSAIPDAPPLTGSTNITAGLKSAREELQSARARADAGKVVILLSDGDHNAPFTGSPVAEANAAKQLGITIITIGLGVNGRAEQSLRDIASRPELYFPAPTGDDLAGVYEEIAGEVGGGGLTDLLVYDLLTSEVEYVPDSANPAPDEINGAALTWRFDNLPPEGWTVTYLVRPKVAGRYKTNKLAYVDYLDPAGEAGSRSFPDPWITVRNPGEQIAVFLPLLYRDYCKTGRPFDVVLALDTSNSMLGEKLDQTRAAAREFLNYLDMPPSKAAIVAFNNEATVVSALSSDRAAGLAAIDALPQSQGTRIDRALQAAVDLLSDESRDANNTPVIILLTDGQQDANNRQAAFNAAAGARRIGAITFTVGVGQDIDPDLLLRIAGRPENFFTAPNSEDLRQIYQNIAGVLPCRAGD